ncbi:MAG TPA: hypothetical protein VGM51_13395 [Armatimonadota bacterium]|jgi:hypothetical protein
MKRIIGYMLSLTFAATTIAADASQLTYNNNQIGPNVTINFPGHSGSRTFEGIFNGTLNGAPADNMSAFNALCVYLNRSTSPGQARDVFATRLPGAGLSRRGRIECIHSALAAGLTGTEHYTALSEGQTGTATWFQSVGQDERSVTGPPPVPESGSMALLGTTALPFLGFCRRRK